MAKFINAGYDNNVNIDKVVAVLNSNSSPSRRMIKTARETQLYVDATEGNKTLSILVTESGHIIASAFRVETLRKRIDELNKQEKDKNI